METETMDKKIQTTKKAEVAPQSPANLLEMIAQAVVDPRMDVDKMERLFVMHEKMAAEHRRQVYVGAMSKLQAKMPQINKDGRIVVKGQERSRYARIEDIDVAIRPLLAEFGFAFSFDTESQDGKLFRISAKLSHEDGHFEVKTLMLPMDVSEYRSNVQSIGSTVSYGKRQLIKMHLNLVEREEDDDGSGGQKVISADQAKDINALITEVRADKERFLVHMGVNRVEDILQRDHKKAINALETKRRVTSR